MDVAVQSPIQVSSPPAMHQTKLDDDKEVQVIESTSSTTTTETMDPEKDGMVTIFSDPINYNIKHPLQSTWVMWYDNPGKKTSQASWADNLKKLLFLLRLKTFGEFTTIFYQPVNYNPVVIITCLEMGLTLNGKIMQMHTEENGL